MLNRRVASLTRSGSSVAPISFRCAIAFPIFLLTLFSTPFPLLAQTKVIFTYFGQQLDRTQRLEQRQ